jgi:hypothetical protein
MLGNESKFGIGLDLAVLIGVTGALVALAARPYPRMTA